MASRYIRCVYLLNSGKFKLFIEGKASLDCECSIEGLNEASMPRDERLVLLLLAEISGVVLVDNPKTGELGRVEGPGLLGRDRFNLCLT